MGMEDDKDLLIVTGVAISALSAVGCLVACLQYRAYKNRNNAARRVVVEAFPPNNQGQDTEIPPAYPAPPPNYINSQIQEDDRQIQNGIDTLRDLLSEKYDQEVENQESDILRKIFPAIDRSLELDGLNEAKRNKLVLLRSYSLASMVYYEAFDQGTATSELSARLADAQEGFWNYVEKTEQQDDMDMRAEDFDNELLYGDGNAAAAADPSAARWAAPRDQWRDFDNPPSSTLVNPNHEDALINGAGLPGLRGVSSRQESRL